MIGKYMCGALLLLLMGCQSASREAVTATSDQPVKETMDRSVRIQPMYAEGFRVDYTAEGLPLVEIQNPQEPRSQIYRFALVPRGTAAGQTVPKEYTPIEIPIRHCICMTSLQLSNFIALEAYDYVSGVTSTRHLFNAEMNERIRNGQCAKIGIEGNFDQEIILSMDPDVIFISPFKRGGYESMKEVHTPLVPHLGYKERTPLGQAEWVKLIGLFIGKAHEANQLFAAIEQRYQSLKEEAAQVSHRPIVFSGEIRGGNWYAVGGKSFLAQLFTDAGADYFLKEDETSGGVTLDFETVYSRADQADYWRIVNSYEGSYSYEALKASDPRYADFKAFQQRQVLYCNMNEQPFYERMPMEPDVVLADLIHAFHPELLPADYEPHYYALLK